MKQYEVYRNIRKKAMIMGLPVSSFAIMMTSVIGSLLVIIFSFSLKIIVGVFLWNLKLFASLSYLVRNPSVLNFKKVFPRVISNKKHNRLDYE